MLNTGASPTEHPVPPAVCLVPCRPAVRLARASKQAEASARRLKVEASVTPSPSACSPTAHPSSNVQAPLVYALI